jgi:hypothetical protein
VSRLARSMSASLLYHDGWRPMFVYHRLSFDSLTIVDGLGGLMIDANVVVVVEEGSPEKSQ